MMDIREHSSQFTVFVLSHNIELGTKIKAQLALVKYESFYFENEETYFDRLTQSPPHIIVFDADSMPGTLSDFTEKTLEKNPEVKFIMLSTMTDLNILNDYSQFGLESVISINENVIDQKVLWSVDRICEKLYYIYQNEQLFSELSGLKEKLTDSRAQLTMAHSLTEFNFSISERVKIYKEAENKEQIIQSFCDQVKPTKICYFKFLPTINSFLLTGMSGFSAEKAAGSGVQLNIHEVKELNEQLMVGLVPPKVLNLVSNIFSISEYKSLPLYVKNNLEGFFVFDVKSTSNIKVPISEEFILFSILYNNFWLEKKVDLLEVQDFVTDLYNRNYYLKTLMNEMARAKRFLQPLSVIKVAIDLFVELEQSLGEVNRDSLLKSAAKLIYESSRANDLVARTQFNEISLILPNCNRKGAILRGERIRRMIEGALFLENGVHITVSIGVSEFPTLCESDVMLDESALKALVHISQKGGNKICLFKPPESFRPAFEVPE